MAQATSPLTSLGTISTPVSYYTARDSPTGADGADTTMSSPVEAPPEPRYRSAKKLPRELSDHCRILLEGELYCSAINILDGLVRAGSAPNPTCVTSWRELGLLANLAVHPSYTSRPSDPNQARVAPCALGHLRSVLATVGPVNARLHKAFTFRRGGGRRPKYNNAHGDDSDGSDGESFCGGNFDDGDSSSDNASIEGRAAQEQSVWRRAPDFWAVVGWAFRCANLHPHRWKFWKVWLEFMLDVLEADWDERQRLDDERWHSLASSPAPATKQGVTEEGKPEGRHPHLKESLFMSYLDALQQERKKTLNEVQRAVFAFADGSQRDDIYYKEVFLKETTLPDKSGKRKRTRAFNLEKDQFGDYLDDDDDQDDNHTAHDAMDCEREPGSPSQHPRRRGRKSTGSGESPFLVTDATIETVPIRLRLFALLSKASYFLAGLCPFDLDHLYDKFADSVRALPIAMFKEFLCSHRTPFQLEVYVKLSRRIIEGLLLTSAPKHLRPEKVDPDNDASDGISVVMLQQCYLPFAAHMIYTVQNSMLSIALEYLLLRLWTDDIIPPEQNTPDLWEAIRIGIRARADKVRSKKGEPAGPDPALEALETSAANLDMLANLLEGEVEHDGAEVVMHDA